jgi:tRNA (guanine37-N1)-methyltransferase
VIQFEVFTIFPGMFTGPLELSIVSRAVRGGQIGWRAHNIRDYTTDKHHTTDDIPYGGGGGMVMKADPMLRAVRTVMGELGSDDEVVLLTPGGDVFSHRVARQLAGRSRIGLICGRYEGVDERVRDLLVTRELSIGDYVLSGGELAAMVVIEAVTRMVPGVLGDPGATFEDSHSDGLLEYPHYTRPPDVEGVPVPEPLLGGNRAQIVKWRREQSLRRTLLQRPDLLGRARLSDEDRRYLVRLRIELDEEN